MFKSVTKIIILMFFMMLIPFQCFAKEYINLNDLIEKSIAFDKKTVTVKAEAIGEPMIRGDHTWVNVNDGTNSMGIWIKNTDTKNLEVYGSYKYKGDILEITGVFSRNCREHGGDIDIHAEKVTVLEKGAIKSNIINVKRLKVATVLIISTFMLGIVYRKRFR